MELPGGIGGICFSVEDFKEFVAEHSRAEVEAALKANRFMGEAEVAALAWVLEREARERAAQFEETLAESRRAADAAARSAKWTMVAAIAAGLGAVAAAIGAVVTAVSIWSGR